jgi:integrase
MLVELVPEPYASMAYVAIYTGLRVSELAGLRWNDIRAQMRHSRSSTTLDIYQQFVSESQQRAVDRLSRLVT